MGRRRAMPTNHGGARLQDVADELGVSRERVRQIEREGLAKARAVLAARGLTLAHFLDAMQRDRHDCAVERPSNDWR